MSGALTRSEEAAVNYDQVLDALKVLGAIPLNEEDSNFQRIVPIMFAYAEGRIYRELTFLATDAVTQVTLTALDRDVVLPTSVLSVRSVAVCTPTGPITRNSRRHHPERTSAEALDMFWPLPSLRPGVPKKYTVIGRRVAPTTLPNPLPPGTQPLPPIFVPEQFVYTVRFMPSPDRAYLAEVFGSMEPLPLSESNPDTFLSSRYPDLLCAACMVFLTGYQRDYGAASDDPQRAVSWEGQYRALRDGVMLEAGQMRGEGPSFTALAPAGTAQPPRSP
jgi:hypothetical protein